LDVAMLRGQRIQFDLTDPCSGLSVHGRPLLA
jgi:hypothetical protein